MMIPLRPASAAAGVSLGATSAWTPSSRTLRAMRWQYCPPASRTVICVGKYYLSSPREAVCDLAPSRVLPRQALLLGDALDQQLLGGFDQRHGFGHGIDSLRDFGILLDTHADRLFPAKRRDIHLALELFLHPLVVRREIGLAEMEAILHQILVKLID